jgi:hypothetical protein
MQEQDSCRKHDAPGQNVVLVQNEMVMSHSGHVDLSETPFRLPVVQLTTKLSQHCCRKRVEGSFVQGR